MSDDAISNCSTLVPNYCEKRSQAIEKVCRDLHKPPGSHVIFEVDPEGRLCYCVCGWKELVPEASPQPERSGRTLADMRAEVGSWLGTTAELSREATVAALVDPRYRRQLAMARDTPASLELLLERPPALPPGAATMAGLGTDASDKTTRELLSSASAALVRWGTSGFKRADEATYERRLAACRRCPHHVDPPRKGLHRLTRAVRAEAKVCGLCGCLTAAKASVLSEACPAAHPEHPELTRWGEPRPADVTPVEEHPQAVSM